MLRLIDSTVAGFVRAQGPCSNASVSPVSDNLQGCANQCLLNSNCHAFTYHSELAGSNCWLYVDTCDDAVTVVNKMIYTYLKGT